LALCRIFPPPFLGLTAQAKLNPAFGPPTQCRNSGRLLVTRRQPYNESIFQVAEEKHQQRQIARLRKQAKSLGFELAMPAA
jgi:hypothetical protein